jgi:hypothetical protein
MISPSNLVTFLLIAPSVLASIIRSEPHSNPGPWCGTKAPAPELQKDFGIDEISGRAEAATSPIVVNTYFHIVTNSTRIQDGYLTVRFSTLFTPHPVQPLLS